MSEWADQPEYDEQGDYLDDCQALEYIIHLYLASSSMVCSMRRKSLELLT